MSDSKDYPLGYSEVEARRLAQQGAMLEEMTTEVLRRAGLGPGMQVLDVGCGVGDVSLLASRMVGAQGAVLGVDRAASSLDTARQRAATLDVKNVTFVESEMIEFETDRTFDALIGRLVLLYIPNPAAALRRLARHVKPGGIVAFQEYDIRQASQSPASALFEQTRGTMVKAFASAGAEVDMGTKLYTTFVQAGLSPPSMSAVAPVGGGADWPGYEYMTAVLRSLLPFIERSGIAKAAEIGIDTLAARLRDDAVANARVAFMPRAVGAWTRTPERPHS
jgi:ubiquinone/menaquinone biosynthesis C-methylase UbiE